MQRMPAQQIARAKEIRDDGSIIEIVVWQLAEPVPPCTHFFKYSLYFGANGACRVRYDNERGKGDHRHVNNEERTYLFSSLNTLLADFESDVRHWEET
jgi:hypothetical protein